MKTIVGNIWTEPEDNGVVKIGFTRKYIEEKLGETFHVMQADARSTKVGTPLLVLETNDGTERIKSPVTGTIHWFNTKARNFPDRLNEEDCVIKVVPEGVTLPKAKAKTTKEALEEWHSVFNTNQINNNWIQQAQTVPAPVEAPQVAPAPPRFNADIPPLPTTLQEAQERARVFNEAARRNRMRGQR